MIAQPTSREERTARSAAMDGTRCLKRIKRSGVPTQRENWTKFRSRYCMTPVRIMRAYQAHLIKTFARITFCTLMPSRATTAKTMIWLGKDSITSTIRTVSYTHLALIGAYKPEGYEWVDELKEVLSGNVNYACDYIEKHFDGVNVSRPEGTYMLFLDCTEWCKKHGRTITELQAAGIEVGVIWQDGVAFHGPCHIRMNLALPLSRVKEAFERLDKYCLLYTSVQRYWQALQPLSQLPIS